ncbi:MAG: NADH-quinone oxidoreductase subunit J family protein [Schwartzia sp. (in: firmicutes)]
MHELLAPVHALIKQGMDLALAFDVPNLISAGVFYVLGTVALLGALGVVFFRNVVHSALSLTASFIGIGCLYIFLSADFMGAVQFLVYGGAVAILIVMAIMLTRREDMAHSNPSAGILAQAGALVVAGLFGLLMAGVAFLSPFLPEPTTFEDTVTGLADLMLTKFILPFEVAAVLLLMAMIGAIVLAKGADES